MKAGRVSSAKYHRLEQQYEALLASVRLDGSVPLDAMFDLVLTRLEFEDDPQLGPVIRQIEIAQDLWRERRPNKTASR